MACRLEFARIRCGVEWAVLGNRGGMSASNEKLPAELTVDELIRLRVQILETLRLSRDLIAILDRLVVESQQHFATQTRAGDDEDANSPH